MSAASSKGLVEQPHFASPAELQEMPQGSNLRKEHVPPGSESPGPG